MIDMDLNKLISHVQDTSLVRRESLTYDLATIVGLLLTRIEVLESQVTELTNKK